ncbi:uncharacterized protein LOC130826504 [Amaranthus tricolor]|uniref:uncharacterized protein LOC130826504 n=1 Tax=Amaranthus tricolor TaxID=29722 RepID=UPI002588E6AA|nr:uncharacterized protein LOC130826504 [Amaranthus tricolor]
MSRKEVGKDNPLEDSMPINSLLAPGILNTPNLAKIKIPNMTAFDGTSCPEEHLMAYKNLMLLYTTNPALWCKFFPTTLIGVALTWYTSLPGGSIHSFFQLEGKFLGHFVASRRQEKSNFHLLSIIQLEGESISSYLKKFHEAVLEVTDLEESVALNALINGMKAQRLKFHLVESQKRRIQYPPIIPQGTERNIHQGGIETTCRVVRNPHQTWDLYDPDMYMPWKEKLEHGTYSTEAMIQCSTGTGKTYSSPSGTSCRPPTTTLSDRRNYNLWCDYHKEHGHTLAQYRELKPILHQLADEGKLSRFINRKDYDTRGEVERRLWNQKRRSPKRDEARRESSNKQGTINMIFGGYTEE